MGGESAKSAILKSVLLAVFGAMVVLSIFFMLTRGNVKKSKSENYKLTPVDVITTTDLSKNYPADPRKVVELYCEILKVLYNEDYTDEQEKQMLTVLAGIMDDELLANQKDFYNSMSTEVKNRRNQEYSFSTYQVNSTTPEEKTGNDGNKYCEVDCYYSLMHGAAREGMYYTFILRKDENKRWKIVVYGPSQNQ